MKVISTILGDPIEFEEVEVHFSDDGLGRFAIAKRPDGHFCIYKHWKASDELHRQLTGSETGVTPWPEDRTLLEDLYRDVSPEIGIFGALEDARREILSILQRYSGYTQA